MFAFFCFGHFGGRGRVPVNIHSLQPSHVLQHTRSCHRPPHLVHTPSSIELCTLHLVPCTLCPVHFTLYRVLVRIPLFHEKTYGLHQVKGRQMVPSKGSGKPGEKEKSHWGKEISTRLGPCIFYLVHCKENHNWEKETSTRGEQHAAHSASGPVCKWNTFDCSSLHRLARLWTLFDGRCLTRVEFQLWAFHDRWLPRDFPFLHGSQIP